MPELNSLLGGGLDPELMESLAQSGVTPPTEGVAGSHSPAGHNSKAGEDLSWDDFLRHLERPATPEYKESRHVCKLDKELSDTLDELNIKSKSRSDLVNAIVRTFFDRHLDRMSEYRQERKSLFKTLKPSQA